MDDKRGISGVITTVLIVLISVAAIGIIGVVLLSFINSNTEKLSLGINTIDLQLEQGSVKYNIDKIDFRIKRNNGIGNLSGVNVIIVDEGGNSVSYKADVVLSELETKPVSVPITAFNKTISRIAQIEVAPVVAAKSGKEYIGSSTSRYDLTRGFVGDNDLIGYWSFDSDAGNAVMDKSGNGNNGVNYGATLIEGKFGNAYFFNATERDYIKSDNSFFIPVEGTMLGWIKANISLQLDENIYPYGFYQFCFMGPRFYQSVKYPRSGVIIDVPENPPDYYVFDWGGNDLFDNNWHSYGVVWNSSSVSLYVDGIQRGTPKSLVGVNYVGRSATFNVGSSWTNGGYGSMNGILDEVRFYNRSLSAQEMYYLSKYS